LQALGWALGGADSGECTTHRTAADPKDGMPLLQELVRAGRPRCRIWLDEAASRLEARAEGA
jgi:hypothetical protein